MNEKAVVAILGEPTKKDGNYYYGTKPLLGEINFDIERNEQAKNYGSIVVKGWSEPFWYLLKKELYEEVKE